MATEPHTVSTPLNVAMVGVTHPHTSGRLHALRGISGVEVTVGADDDPVGSIFFDHFGIEQRPVEAVLSDPAVDAVIVHSHSAEMTPLAVAAMRAGKPVLVEKPGGRTLDDLEELAAVADETGLTCQVGFNFRPAQSFQRGLDLVSSGALGRVLGTRIHGGCSSDEAATSHVNGPGELGGALWVIGSHLVDVALMYFGSPESVNAQVPKFSGFQDESFREDAASITLNYPDQLVSFDFNSWDALPWIESWSMSIYGTNGELHMRALPAELRIRLREPAGGYPAGWSTWVPSEFVTPWAGKRTDFSPLLAEVTNTDFFDAEVSAFVDSVRGSRASAMATAADALTVARIVDSAYRSSSNRGAAVALPVAPSSRNHTGAK